MHCCRVAFQHPALASRHVARDQTRMLERSSAREHTHTRRPTILNVLVLIVDSTLAE